jgi:hypothetical protein
MKCKTSYFWGIVVVTRFLPILTWKAFTGPQIWWLRSVPSNKLKWALIASPFHSGMKRDPVSETVFLWNTEWCMKSRNSVIPRTWSWFTEVAKKVKLFLWSINYAIPHEGLWGSGGRDKTFLTSAPVGGEWPASHLNFFTPGQRAPGTHCIEGCVDPRTGLGNMERRKILPYWTSNADTLAIQTVASCYTNCSIPALRDLCNVSIKS